MKRLSLSLAFGLTAVILSTSCKPKPKPVVSAPVVATPDATAATSDNPAPAAENAPAQDGGMQGGGGGNRGGRGGGGGNFQQRADQRMAQMKTTLGLTDDQAQKIRAVYDQQFGALRQQGGNNSTMSREDRRAAFEKARAAANAQIDQILTPDQKPKWEALQQQMQQQMQQRRQGGGGGGGGGGRRFGGGGGGGGQGGGNRGGN